MRQHDNANCSSSSCEPYRKFSGLHPSPLTLAARASNNIRNRARLDDIFCGHICHKCSWNVATALTDCYGFTPFQPLSSLAFKFSRSMAKSQSASTPVDYMSPKGVKKMGGGGPGMVKYDGADVVRGEPSR